MQILRFIFKLYFTLTFLILVAGCDDSDNRPSSPSPAPPSFTVNKDNEEKDKKNSINIDIQDGIICIGDNQTIAVKEPSNEKDKHSTPTDPNKKGPIVANKPNPLQASKGIKPDNIEVNVQNGFAVVSIGSSNNISSDLPKKENLTPEQIKEKIEKLEGEFNELDALIKKLKDIETAVENIKNNIDEHINKAEAKLKSIEANDPKKDQIKLALDKAKPKQTIINNLLKKIGLDIKNKVAKTPDIKTKFEGVKAEENHLAKQVKIADVIPKLKTLIAGLNKAKTPLELSKYKAEKAEKEAELPALETLL